MQHRYTKIYDFFKNVSKSYVQFMIVTRNILWGDKLILFVAILDSELFISAIVRFHRNLHSTFSSLQKMAGNLFCDFLRCKNELTLICLHFVAFDDCRKMSFFSRPITNILEFPDCFHQNIIAILYAI